MILKMFAVYDSKAEAYFQPFFMATNGQALRAFKDLANDPKSNICRHPGDYTLFVLGEYDDETGNVLNLGAKINLGTGLEHKSREENALQFPQFKPALGGQDEVAQST